MTAPTLAYDNVLSRVQITGASPVDSFTRTVASGWGSTSVGSFPWTTSGGVAGDYSVNGTIGIHSVGAVNSTRRTLLATVSLLNPTAVIQTKTGAGIFAVGARIEAALLLRYIDVNNYYSAHLFFNTDQSMTVRLFKRVAGTPVFLTETVVAGLTHTSDTFFSLKFEVVGSQLRARAWQSTLTEPTVWHAEFTDASISTAGQVGVESLLATGNTNTLPVDLSRDSFSVTVEVERSTDQVRWTAIRGLSALLGAFVVDDYEFAANVTNYYRAAGETANITPNMTDVWLKSLARPFLNRKVTVVDWSDVERSSRSGVFPIVGRSFPVAVTDLHGSRRWTLDVLAQTVQGATDLDLLLSTGEVQFVHVPAAERVPGGYVALGDTSERRPGRRSIRRVFSLPLTEVAAPGPDVIPAVGLWSTVVNTYSTWSAVLAAHSTWNDVLQLVGSPADIVVP